MYLTLPSNTVDYTNSNKTNSYRVQLPEPVSLDGRWEVALVDIQYPFSWRNVFGEHIIQALYTTKQGKNVWLKGKIPEGYYGDVSSLIAGIKLGIRDAARRIPMIESVIDLVGYRTRLLKKYRPNETTIDVPVLKPIDPEIEKLATKQELQRDGELYRKWKEEQGKYKLLQADQRENADEPEAAPVSDVESALTYSFASGTNRLHLHLDAAKSINTIKLPDSIKYMLGLEGAFIKAGTNYPKYSPDLSGGLSTLFVHCSIVEPQVIGNSKSELLRTVPINSRKRFGDIVHELFVSPHYIEVLHKNFDHINIEIRSDTGEPIPFEFGKVVCKLHFRKSKGW